MAGPTRVFRMLHHVCIVVQDIEKAVEFYLSVGIGPWFDYPPLEEYTQLKVPDRQAFLHMKYKYTDLDNIQIQLCQPGEGESPQRRYLEERGEGVFHLGFTVPDCDAAEAAAQAFGLEVLLSGRRNDRSGFSYFDTSRQGAGVTLEIREAKRT